MRAEINARNDKNTAKGLSCDTRIKLITTNISKNAKAASRLMSPRAKGLFFVLFTFASIFLSAMSFAIQPAERIKTVPKVKITINFTSGN